MRTYMKVLLIIVAVVLGGFTIHTLASQTPQESPDYLEDCAADEQSDCAARCIIEHNCCIKSCNWVEKKAKSKCLEHCESILKKCYQDCDKNPE